MKYPDFFNKVETIRLYDRLAHFLGSFEKGIIEYSFVDIVKATGHGCIIVVGAYLSTLYALKELYKKEIPERGKIKVELPLSLEEGTQGVIASVISHITGATDKNGFKGLNGRFSRINLMHFNTGIKSFARFTRIDNGKSVEIHYNPGKLISPGNILGKMLSTKPESEEFKNLKAKWLDSVKEILENPEKVIETIEINH